MIKEWGTRFVLGAGLAVVLPGVSLAHEPYVLTGLNWKVAYAEPWYDFLLPLSDMSNASLLLGAGLGYAAVFVLAFLFWKSKVGQGIAQRLEQFKPVMFVLLRLALALSLALGALKGNIFGPELSLAALPYGEFARGAIYALAFLLAIGWMTELAALAVLVLYIITLWAFGSYVLVYLHYVLLAAALATYGAGRFSVDSFLDRQKEPSRPRPFQITWLRLAMGIALIVGAVMIKVLHPAVTLAVVNQYQIFPANPAFFAMGATISELMFGLFLLIGFQSRTVAVVALVMLIAAQLFFKEILWPHLPLYALALYIIAAGNGPFSLDRWLAEHLPNRSVK